MIWQYFPIGFRFPVSDFSDKTKSACWQTAISALLACGGIGATLYEAQETYDFGSDGPVYTCIACFYGVKQSRAVAKKLYELDTLMTELCLLHPFVQANYLESYGPYPILGKLVETGVAEITEAGETFLPRTVGPMPSNDGLKVLIASEPLAHAASAERFSSLIGCTVASLGFRVQRTALAANDTNLVRSLVSASNGRYESVTVTNGEGERVTETLGVLPGERAVLELNDRFDDVLLKAYDLGFRKFISGVPCREDMQVSDPRFAACSFSYLFRNRSGIESYLDLIGFEPSAKKSDLVILFADTHSETTESILSRLQEQQKPTIVMASDANADPQSLMRSFPVVRDVLIPNTDPVSYEKTVSDSVAASLAKATGKAVAKAAAI